MAGNWEEARLGELCDFRAGAVFKPSLQGQTSGEFPFVKVSDMNLPANAVRIQDANNWVSAARTTRHRPHPRHAGRQDRAEPADERDAGGDGAGALQVVVRGLRPRPRQGRRATTGRSGVLGKVFYVAEDFWPLNTSLWVKEFRHSRPAYAFHLLRGLDFALFNAGSAVPTLNRNHVHTLPTLLPPIGLIDAFERFATRCLARQRNSDQQSTTLATMRDALLPKLISGELRVAAAEKILENAV
jgi:hypothetical protein